jgi:hypothetical protein
MRPAARIIPILLLASSIAGCASSGIFPTANITDVQLSAANFRVLATNVTGEAQADYVLGVSAAIFSEMRTFAVARIDGSGMLYREAVQDLWANFERQHGAAAGRSVALVNVRFDSEAVNLLVFTRPRVSVQADVVEFTP